MGVVLKEHQKEAEHLEGSSIGRRTHTAESSNRGPGYSQLLGEFNLGGKQQVPTFVGQARMLSWVTDRSPRAAASFCLSSLGRDVVMRAETSGVAMKKETAAPFGLCQILGGSQPSPQPFSLLVFSGSFHLTH